MNALTSKNISVILKPVVVGQLDVVSRYQDLAIFQPDEVRLRDALGHTGEHSTASCWFGHRLWPLQELRRSWKRAGREKGQDTDNSNSYNSKVKYITKSCSTYCKYLIISQRPGGNVSKQNYTALYHKYQGILKYILYYTVLYILGNQL